MKSSKSIEKENQQDIKFTELPFNHQETLKLENSTLYVKYKAWLKENGVIVDPRLRYPSYFGAAPNGVIGIGAMKPIQRQRAIIAVPYNLLITVDKARQNKDLKFIIDTSFVVFGKKDDIALKILILYVIYEMLKGEKSFYHPYFSICNTDSAGCWSNWTAYKLEHRGVMKDLKLIQEDIQLEFMKFLRIFRGHQKTFPQNLSNTQYRSIFEKAYYLVTTRAFGWSLPSISLIPMADSLNHGNIRYLNHFLTNIDLQKDSKCAELKFRSQINLSIFKDEFFTLNNEELAVLRKEPRSKQLKFIEKHKEILIQSQKLVGLEGDKAINIKSKSQARNKHFRILYQQYKAGIHKLKNLHFYQSSCTEDNDTDEDQIYDRQHAKQTYELQDVSRVVTQVKKKKEVKKLWKLYYDNEQSSQQEEDEEKETTLPSLKNESLKMEIEEKMNKNQNSSEVQSEQLSEEDQEFAWIDEANHQRTYFVMNTKEIIRQNEQIYNFYGRRSNKFLLLGYNFIMKNNVYDSYGFKLKLDEKIASRVPASKLIDNGNKKQNNLNSREIRLKRFRINKDLIDICRSYVILWTKKQWKNCRIGIPFDREVEQKTFELYQELVNHMLKEFSTTLEEDEQEESEVKVYEERLAIGIRIEYKKILQGQCALLSKCLAFLKKWKVNQIQDFEQSDMKWIKRTKSYLLALEKGSTL